MSTSPLSLVPQPCHGPDVVVTEIPTGSAQLRLYQYHLVCLSLLTYLVVDHGTRAAVVVDPHAHLVNALRCDLASARWRLVWVALTVAEPGPLAAARQLVATQPGARVVTASSVITPPLGCAHGPTSHLCLGQVGVEITAVGMAGTDAATGATTGTASGAGAGADALCVLAVRYGGLATPVALLTGSVLVLGDTALPAHVGDGTGLRAVASTVVAYPDTTILAPGWASYDQVLGRRTWSSLGEQKRTNHILATARTRPPPRRWPAVSAAAHRAATPIDVDEPKLPPWSWWGLDETTAAATQGAWLVDVRPAARFAASHLRTSVHLPWGPTFALGFAALIPAGARVVWVGDEVAVNAAGRWATHYAPSIQQLGAVDVVGRAPAWPHWDQWMQSSPRLTYDELGECQAIEPGLVVADVRTRPELATGWLTGSTPWPLASLPRVVASLDPGRPVVLYCHDGTRSTAAASWLRRHGFDHVSDLVGGCTSWPYR